MQNRARAQGPEREVSGARLVGIGVLLPALVGAAAGGLRALLHARRVILANGYGLLDFRGTAFDLLIGAADRGVLSGLWLGLLASPLVLGFLLLLRRWGPGGASAFAARVLGSRERTLAAMLALAGLALAGVLALAMHNRGLAVRDVAFFGALTLLCLGGVGWAGRGFARRAAGGDASKAPGACALAVLLAAAVFLTLGLVLHRSLTTPARAPLAALLLLGGTAFVFLAAERAARGVRVLPRVLSGLLLLLLVVAASSPALVRAARASASPEPLSVRRPLNVLVIAIDTLRTDHTTLLPPREGERDLTPELRKLAARGTLFENADSQSPWTMPAFASILTGKYPVEHGALSILGRLRDREVTLAEILREAGYRTEGIVSHIMVDRERGFAQGFERFDDSLSSPDGFGIPAPHVTDRALDFLGKQDGDEPFFLFLHYFDPHHEYIDHPEYDDASWYEGWLTRELPLLDLTRCAELFGETETQYLRDLYDEEIRGTDREIGRLLDGLAADGLQENTLVVLCADHGEQFMERGYLGHVRSLYEELLRVPLVVVDPGSEHPGEVVTAPVETRRAFDEVLDALGVDYDGHGDGGRPVDHTIAEDEPVYATVWLPDGSPWLRFQLASVRRGPWKLIRDYRRGGDLLYRLDTDPGERTDLSEAEPERVESLGTLLDTWILGAIERGELAPAKEVTAEERAKLEALGYM